ncbi:MAG: glycosyl transferase [Flavobacteriales bacterium]|nr:glycosyl transferase [Flavobacteriales bacterium]
MNTSVKILIIRFSSIGDIVLTTPVIRCLKNQIEGDVELHYITKKVYLPLLAENPYLDKIYSIEKSTNEVIEELKAEKYDYIIDLHKNMRARRVKRKLKALSFTFDKLNIRKWLLVNFKWNKMPELHIVDRYLAAAKAFDIKYDGEGLDYFLPKNINSQIELPNKVKNGYTALVLGANHATKQIPENKLKSIIEKSTENFVLIGGKDDAALGERLELIAPDRVWNTAGEMSLHQSAYIIQQANSVITPDTGMMHIAAAFQKRVISLWGNTVPEFGMYPLLKKGNENQSTIFEVKDLSCRPCSKIGFNKCPKGHFNCMMLIDESEVIKKI